MTDLVEQILDYERMIGGHQCGSFAPDAFRALARALPPSAERSIETGTGKSTVLLSNVSARHLVFTLDDSRAKRSSLRLVRDCPLFRPEKTQFVLGPTQSTLPAYSFNDMFDIALLDGPHAYPFPELEYYFIYPRLKQGALLIIDDIDIPTVGHLFRVLREDPMFELAAVIRTTAVLRRTDAPLFDPLADGWWTQAYNARRFKQPSKRLLSVLRTLGLYGPARRVYRRLKRY